MSERFSSTALCSPSRGALVRPQATARPEIGFLYVLSIPIAAGIAFVRGFDIGGFNYTGWIWMLYLVGGVFVLAVDRALHRPRTIAIPYFPWLIWFGFVWLSLAWTHDLGRRQVQEAIQVTMPLLVGAVASVFVRTERKVELLLRTFRWSIVVLAISTAIANLGDSKDVDLLTGSRPLGMTASLVACVYLAEMPWNPVAALTGWATCIVLNFFMGARTITVGLILLLIFNPLVKGFGKRLIFLAAIAGLGLAIFYTPQFQSRFFYSGHGSLSDLGSDDVRGSGRFDAWPLILKEAWKHPVLGTGIGSAYDFVPTVWEGINQVHNDFLRVGFEFGLVGLALFVPTLIWQTVRLWRDGRKTTGATRCAFAAAFLGMLVYLINACTDNPLGYNVWFTNPLFALIGAAYGAAQEDSATDRDTENDSE
jgi:hypothetical protein